MARSSSGIGELPIIFNKNQNVQYSGNRSGTFHCIKASSILVKAKKKSINHTSDTRERTRRTG